MIGWLVAGFFGAIGLLAGVWFLLFIIDSLDERMNRLTPEQATARVRERWLKDIKAMPNDRDRQEALDLFHRVQNSAPRPPHE